MHGGRLAAANLTGFALVFVLSAGLVSVLPSTASAAGIVSLSPTDNIDSIVDSKPSGTTFVFEAGVYRGFSIKPKSDTSFIGQPGAILSGSRQLTGWSVSSGLWKHTGQHQGGDKHGVCKSGSACKHPEDIYVDNVILQQVTSKSAVTANTFYFDYGANTVWIGQDPLGKVVEIGYVDKAFFGNASNVTIEGFVIEKYANPAQTGAIHAKRGSQDLAVGWIIRNNEVRWNHGTGIKMGRDTLVSGNFVHHNGQLGIGSGSTGTGNIVENNEISYNTTIPFSVGWEAGGAKFGKEEGLLVRGNYVHNNYGPGLWVDVGSKGIVFDNNIVAYNNNAGIYYEISYDATIKNNTVVGNGFESPWLWGPGILIAHSPNADVYNNVVVDNAQGIIGIQQPRGSGTYGAFEVRNMKVYNNVIVSTDGETGIAQPASNDPAIFNTWGNDFYDNTYYFDDIDAKNYRWKFSIYTKSQWQSVDNDTDGEWFNRSSFTMPPLPPEGLSWKGPSGGSSFSDITDSVFEDDILWLANHGITNGCNPPSNTRYCPDDPITRGQMAAFLDRALHLPQTPNDYFIDDNTSAFEGAINRLRAAGITSGCNTARTKYCGEAPVSRGQMAAFLTRALGLTDDGGGDLFVDDNGSLFELDIDRVATAGITKGCNPPANDRFCPESAVTRGQMAAFLHRTLG